MNDNMIEIRYRLLAQYPDDKVKVEDVKTKDQFVLPVAKIACDKQFITYFSGQDACTIGYIMGSQTEDYMSKRLFMV